MNTAEIEAQAYKVQIAQGEAILLVIDEIKRQLDSANRTVVAPPLNTAAILDLARAMSNLGGRPA